jgi:acetyltransferase-like isoleucine patch superfamily enzyme
VRERVEAVRSAYISYGFMGLCDLALDLILSRISFRGCRLVRRPFYVRGRKWIHFGRGLTVGRGLRIEAEGNDQTKELLIRIGTSVSMNDYVHIGAVESISIGNGVLIASKVFITDHDHGAYGRGGVHTDPSIPPRQRKLSSAPVVIEDDVWLGEFVSVLAGARIGKGSVIGSMSTVMGNIPPYCIAVGSPARVVKRYNFDSRTWVRI